MPIPKPQEGETKTDFLERCMGNPSMVAEYEPSQRYAICTGQWENRNMAEKVIRNYAGQALVERAAGRKTVRYRFSSDTVDRHRSIIDQEGLRTSSWNRIIMWGHDAYGGLFSTPNPLHVIGKCVGSVEKVKHRQGMATEGEVLFAKDENPVAGMVEGMVRGGYLRDCSIGFRPLAPGVREEVKGVGEVLRYPKTELLEVSIVPVGSNPEAQSLIRSMYEAMTHQADAPEGDGWRFDPENGNWILRLERGPEAGSSITLPAIELLEALQGYSSRTEDFTGHVPGKELPPDPPALAAADVGQAAAIAVREWITGRQLRSIMRAVLVDK
jgi:hypothetical protein